ncbi:hypothetical protein ACFYVR_16270 [Rhodococcus sp. NPDC003318]|uniref:hypothetical protein n=1 Tax=Rhodococcus sp. NPDC003318 TaxID=3364503 RepID=UPI0036A38768
MGHPRSRSSRRGENNGNNTINLRAAAVAAAVTPALMLAAPTATASPAVSAGAAGEVSVSVPAGENWSCVGVGSTFGIRAGAFGVGVGKIGGFAKGNVTVLCLGTAAPFVIVATVSVK